MTRTTRVLSVSVPVQDQDRALAYYTEVLGCEVRTDVEVSPGNRLIEVVPPGSEVGICLLDPDGWLPIAVRLGTTDADEAHARIDASDGKVGNEEVLRWDGVPPMFAFEDPDGNALVYLQDQ